jgi:plasmid stabilization system protein ParE
MAVRYTDAAIAEISALVDYIAADNREAARAMSKAIAGTVLRVEAMPLLGRLVHRPDIRSVKVGRFAYRVFLSHRRQHSCYPQRSQHPSAQAVGS